ncbi:related to 3-dehydroshikimate dehydratase [Rhynchosporium agropyri]|uniref:Related to 3-dehydroshikimate dehydratase n=1 Tax=Rhynchosporium agropyri TaxID=914238 RepID=A0A1E1KFK2_9HELO|nr:related to 3-dehydroshikimate dehydratase [Rhynchosporium agropyri]
MSYKPAICSMSLGRAWAHNLSPKLTAAASASLPGIEIFFEDLVYLASSFPGGPTPSNQILAAHQIRTQCTDLNLEIMGIGPFNNCEGLLSAPARAKKMEELHLWFDIARILGTDIIQIPCTFMTEGVTGDLDIVARDLREISDLGAAQNPHFKFAYENLCWGTFNDTWEKAWAVVEAVDRDNFGLCLDTFNVAGREYADPCAVDGKCVDADVRFRESIGKMARTIDVKKVFYVQAVDAERLRTPMCEEHPFHVDGQKPRMSWSRNCRLFMCEEDRGGHLPVMDVLRAICDEKDGLGYKGWISMELFNRSLLREDPSVPFEHANRAMSSWWKIVKAMSWEGMVESQPIVAVSRGAIVPLERADISARL